MKTSEAIELLRARHPQKDGRWANVVEFCSIDFLAVACWPSDGFVVHGYEIKVSRADWLRELRSPGKSVESMAHCDFWWLAAPAGVVKPGELPEGWGFIELGSKCRVRSKGPQLREPYDGRTYLRSGDRSVINQARVQRSAFAMMARRFAYADADRGALMGLGDEPGRRKLLDSAATLTGRFTSRQRQAQRSRAKWKAKQRCNDRTHREHMKAGERTSVDCPVTWCAEQAAADAAHEVARERLPLAG